MFARKNSRLAAGFVVVGVVAGSSFLAAAPANAAAGDASALGASAVIAADLPIVGLGANASIGGVSVTAPGSETTDEDDVALVDLALADVTVGAVTSQATSNAAGSAGSAEIADAQVSLFGLDVLSLDTAAADAVCPTVGTPTAAASVAGLTLLGGAATVDADNPAEATVGLGADIGGLDLSALDLTVRVTQVEEVVGATASATALVAVVTLDGQLGDTLLDGAVIATVTLASAACEAPAVVAVTATTITPTVGPTTGGQTVTITGSGFTPETIVTFAGTPATDVTVNADGTSLTAVTPAGVAGPTTVTVANPGSAATLAYTYVEPTVASLTPTSGPEYGGTTVTISGAGLNTTTNVTFDGVPAEIVSVSPDGTSVVVTSPAGDGSADIVLTSAGGSTLTADDAFIYIAPSVTVVNPSSGPTAGGTTVTITGEGLAGTTGVLFGDTPGTIVGTPSDTEVVVTTPAGVVGDIDVTVVLPGDDIVVPDGFEYVAAPVIDAVAPAAGPETGGTVVVVDGSGFIPGATTVTVCGVVIPASQVSVNAAGTQLQFTTPACDPGAAPLAVTTAGGIADGATFTFTAAAVAVNGNGNASGVAPGSNRGSLANSGVSTVSPIGMALAFLIAGSLAAGAAMVRRRNA